MKFLGYIAKCNHCNYESSIQKLPQGYNLQRCPKCGGELIWTPKYSYKYIEDWVNSNDDAKEKS